MEKQNYYVVSFSGGKDSTAMLLRLLELGEQIDEVICCDTYKEFPQMYKHIEKVRKIVDSKGIKFTLLRHEWTFDYWFYDYEPKRRKPEEFKARFGDAKGKSWARSRARWCSGELKIKLMDKYFNALRSKYNVIKYVGIAADETARIERKNNQQEGTVLPLVNWGWTEEQCLNYCYSLGYDWDGLYKIFTRVSCWCCPLQSLEELRKLRKHFPELWEELRAMDAKTWQQFRKDYSVEDLEIRFVLEEQWLQEGKNIRSKAFYKELKEVIGNAADQLKA